MAANVSELGVVKVAKPCGRDWEKMTGDERARFCADCQLHVYNLSAMTTEEARELIREKEGELCVRFFTRPDGTVLTRDCPVGVKRHRKRLVAAGAGAVSLSLAALAFAVTESFTEAESEPCAAAPLPRPDPATPPKAGEQQPTPPADESWMEQRRRQLGARELARPTHVMGRMSTVQVIRGADEPKP